MKKDKTCQLKNVHESTLNEYFRSAYIL